MKRTLALHREELIELTDVELAVVHGGSTPLITDGHHCFGTSLCGAIDLTRRCV